jgi:hypothetical protein
MIPGYGTVGAAYATVWTEVFLTAALVLALRAHDRRG